jgi:hypothetical protein
LEEVEKKRLVNKYRELMNSFSRERNRFHPAATF